MRKVLYLFGQLDDQDIEWMASTGIRLKLKQDAVLISEGKPITSMYILLEGAMQAATEDYGVIAELSPGEVIGEISFVDSAPPTATVSAIEDCVLLELSRDVIEQRIGELPVFGRNFYKALAIFLADRMRGTVKRMGFGEEGDLQTINVMEDELDDSVLDTVSNAGARFDRMLVLLSGNN